MKAVFLDFATVSNGDLDTSSLDALLPGLDYHAVTGVDEVAGRVRDAAIIFANKVRLDRPVIEAAGGLRLVCLAATGTDSIDLEAASERAVAVTNIRNYCTASVVQQVFAMILSLTQHLSGYQRLLESGAWRANPQFCLLDFPIRELAGRTLGIVGMGVLGSGVARVAEALGMQVRVAARPGAAPAGERVALDELLALVDVLSLHCPLTPQTAGLIGARELALMKSDALLINTARGGLVDASALCAALRAGRLGGAGIDVLVQEPPVDGNPLLAGDVPNLIVTPHVAWAAREARQRALDEMVANAAAFVAGERRNRVI